MNKSKINIDKCYKITFMFKIGNSNWVISKKIFCDNEKDFKNFLKKAIITIDNKNKNNIHSNYKLILEEYIDNKWVKNKEYPEIK